MMEIEYKIALSILIPFTICFYIYAIYRLKESGRGVGLIGWKVTEEQKA